MPFVWVGTYLSRNFTILGLFQLWSLFTRTLVGSLVIKSSTSSSVRHWTGVSPHSWSCNFQETCVFGKQLPFFSFVLFLLQKWSMLDFIGPVYLPSGLLLEHCYILTFLMASIVSVSITNMCETSQLNVYIYFKARA